MKATVVPAQVTTVEDRVAGNLGFSQLTLFAIPVFGGALLYATLPPSMDIALYKIITIVVLAIVSSILAIRIKGKIILFWLAILLRYNLRPKYYLFNKNTALYREDYPEIKTKAATMTDTRQTKSPVRLPRLSLLEMNEVYALLDNPGSQIRFETTKKGGLSVHLTEIQEQS